MDIAWYLYYKILSFFNNPQFLQSFFDNRFYLILLVVVLMRFKYTTYRSMWMSALVNIPGTFLHELMHFLVGALFNAKPCNFTLFPKKNENGDYVMGSVGFRNIAYYNAIPEIRRIKPRLTQQHSSHGHVSWFLRSSYVFPSFFLLVCSFFSPLYKSIVNFLIGVCQFQFLEKSRILEFK